MVKIPPDMLKTFISELGTMPDPILAKKWSYILDLKLNRAYIWQWRNRLRIKAYIERPARKRTMHKRIEYVYPNIGRELLVSNFKDLSCKYNVSIDALRRCQKRLGITKQDKYAHIIRELRIKYKGFDRTSIAAKRMAQKYPAICISKAFNIHISTINAFKMKHNIGRHKIKAD